jgi:hypothetical protein
VLTQDPLAMHHLHRTLAEIRPEATRLRYDVTARRLAATAQIDGQLTQLGHPLAAATAWLREAQATLEQARKLLDTNDFENSLAATAKAEHLLARVRRGHWQQTAAAFPSPAASPCVAQFTTLPLHWAVADRLRQGQWGPNAQAAGDMESLETMLQAGWQQQRQTGETIGTATFSGNTLYLRKSDGELIGSVVTAPDGSRTLYDPSGNVMGKVTTVPAGPPAGRP